MEPEMMLLRLHTRGGRTLMRFPRPASFYANQLHIKGNSMRTIGAVLFRVLFPVAFILFILSGCAKKDGDQVVLARIGDRDITVKEFEYRCEFTIRPKYMTHKGIELNRILLDNLIDEKILAMEAGDTSRMARNKMFNAYIQGIREQAMREELFFKSAYNRVRPDTQEIKSLYRFTGREYRLAFYTLTDDNLARKVIERIATNPSSAGAVFDGIGGDRKPPEQRVSWKDPSSEPIFNALFTHPVGRDSVIGPLRIDRNLYVMMKVIDWKDEIALGQTEQQKRWNDVVERIKKRDSNALWNRMLEKLIGGKTIQFNPPVFKKLAELSYDLSIASGDSQSRDIVGDFLKNNADASKPDAFRSEKGFLKSPFLTFDGKTWTVEDFKNELAVHPLVYRTKNFTRQTFPREFKNAVADLMRDHYLTGEAYRNHLQKLDAVARKAAMWRDAMTAAWSRDQILAALAKKHHIEGQPDRLTSVYTAYMDSLRNAYAGRIRIEEPELQKIQLTNSDMIAYKPGVPYPMAVPNFQAYIMNR
jgi:hypothetical protein